VTIRRVARLVTAIALTLVTVTVTTAIDVRPALAAPDGQCTIRQWQKPGNWIDCTKRLHQAASDILNCAIPPTPSSPTSGAAGMLAARPDADTRPGNVGLYSQYGLAGYHVQTYAAGCASTFTDPAASWQNHFADALFTTATMVLGVANYLRTLAYNPTDLWGDLDQKIADTTEDLYGHVYVLLAGLVLIVVGIYLVSQAHKGRLSDTAGHVGWTMLVIIGVAAIGASPLGVLHGVDTLGQDTLATVHAYAGPAPFNAEPCEELDPEWCVDNRDVATRANDEATEAVLYRNWLTAEFGSATSPTAKKYGTVLYDAQTFTWGEAADANREPAQRRLIIDEKARRWKSIAHAIADEDPEAYEHLRGERGSDRIVAGISALTWAVVYSLFDGLASFIILLSFALFRFALPLAPIFGLVGLFLRTSGPLRGLINRAVGALANIAVFGIAGGLYLKFAGWIITTSLNQFAQLVVLALFAVAGLFLLRPHHRVNHLLLGRPSLRGGPAKPGWLHRMVVRNQDSKPAATTADTLDDERPRPETVAPAAA
jgi:hypothetical protein